MSSQIFKSNIDINILFDLLNTICDYNGNYYILNDESYKKAIFHNIIITFLNQIKSYYHTSKYHYIQRKMTYTHFITIIRQILHYHNIHFVKKMKYNNSTYNIIYYIYTS